MKILDGLKSALPWITTTAKVASSFVPFGPLVAQAVGVALGQPDLKPESMDQSIAIAMSKDPEGTLLRLKEADNQLQETMAKLGYDHIEKLEEIAASDRASARAREIAVRDRTPMILAFATTAGFFIALGLLLFFPIPTESHDVVIAMIASLGTLTAGVSTYYFGSSAGSSKKTDALIQGPK